MEEEYPVLHTQRLIMRQFHREEATIVRTLAGAYGVAHGCQVIPHPYEPGIAEAWISCHETWFSERSQVIFAITRKEDWWIVGAAGLVTDQDHNRAEIGYWIGVPFWGHGYATEAAAAVIRYAFDDLRARRVTASYFRRNPASGRVLEKLGMKQEGLLRSHILKEGVYEDVVVCGILGEEWRKLPGFHGTRPGGKAP